MDASSAEAAQNSDRHAPQRTSASEEIVPSLPINVVALAKAHGPNVGSRGGGARNSAERASQDSTQHPQSFLLCVGSFGPKDPVVPDYFHFYVAARTRSWFRTAVSVQFVNIAFQ